MNPRAVVLVLIIAAFLGGYLLGRRSSPATASASRQSPERDPSTPPVAAPVVAEDAPSVPPSEVASVPTAVPGQVVPASSLVELNAKLRQKFWFTMFDHQGRIEDDFAHIFGLSPAERATLDAYAVETQARMAQLEAQHAVITEEDADTLTVTIPALPEQGGLLYTQFVEQVRLVLGEARYAAVRELSSNGIEAATRGRFGLSETVIQLHRNARVGSSTSQWTEGYARFKVQTMPELLRRDFPRLHARLEAEGRLNPPPR